MTTKDNIVSLLASTGRSGMNNLIAYLNTEGFFESPGSRNKHDCYIGGLADHCLKVYSLLFIQNVTLELNIDCHSLVIAGLLHDLCKVGSYQGITPPYTYKSNQPNGHGLLSVNRVQSYIKLNHIEKAMIEYHMGIYGTYEFDGKYSEYSLQQLLGVWSEFPIVKVMYFCDELATMIKV